MQQQTGKAPQELEPLPLSECVAYLWGWFCDLSNGRGDGPLTFSEIQAWSNMMKTDPKIWEIEVIKALDRAFLAEVTKK